MDRPLRAASRRACERSVAGACRAMRPPQSGSRWGREQQPGGGWQASRPAVAAHAQLSPWVRRCMSPHLELRHQLVRKLCRHGGCALWAQHCHQRLERRLHARGTALGAHVRQFARQLSCKGMAKDKKGHTGQVHSADMTSKRRKAQAPQRREGGCLHCSRSRTCHCMPFASPTWARAAWRQRSVPAWAEPRVPAPWLHTPPAAGRQHQTFPPEVPCSARSKKTVFGQCRAWSAVGLH